MSELKNIGINFEILGPKEYVDKKTGAKSYYFILKIDTKKSEPFNKNVEIYPYTKVIQKYKYSDNNPNGLKYNKIYNWFWTLSADKDVLVKQFKKNVKPCIDELLELERKTHPESTRTIEDVIDNITWENLPEYLPDLIANIKKSTAEPKAGEISMSKDEIENKLRQLQHELENIVSSEEFIEKMTPYINLNAAMQKYSHEYSIGNTILIYLQKPDAKLVLNLTEWGKLNKRLKTSGEVQPIALWCPRMSKVKLKDSEIKNITDRYIAVLRGKNPKRIIDSYDDLTKEEQNELNDLLKSNEIRLSGYTFQYRFYDISDVEQIPGTKDLIGNITPREKLKWYDAESPETEYTRDLFNATVKAITGKEDKTDFYLDFELISKDEMKNRGMGNSRGYATADGKISVLEGPLNAGIVSTCIHELTHELMHFPYASSKNENLKQFFIGGSKEQGKSAIEIQADLSAWIVLNIYGIKTTHTINYMGIWGSRDKLAGLSRDNFIKVFMKPFSSVAKTSNFIVKSINKYRTVENDREKELEKDNTITEELSPGFLYGKDYVTPLDVAKAIGMEDLYKKAETAAKKLHISNI